MKGMARVTRMAEVTEGSCRLGTESRRVFQEEEKRCRQRKTGREVKSDGRLGNKTPIPGTTFSFF